MEASEVVARYNLFRKYAGSAIENNNLKDYQTANQLREKIAPQIIKDMTDENTSALVGIFEQFSEFLFEYYLCLDENRQSVSYIGGELKRTAEKIIELDSDNFFGNFFLAAYYSFNLKTAHAGSGDVIHKGKSTEESIVGTAFNLIGKGLTLGVTATAAGISKSNFTNSVKRVVEVYKIKLAQKPLDVGTYFTMTSKMFNMAEFCESINNSIWRDIYTAIRDFNADMLDYSVLDDEIINEVKEKATEMIILADSKV